MIMSEEGFDGIIAPKESNQSNRHRQNNRIRIVRLNRNRSSISRSFGFSLRGGKEYGTGFFVSHVEKGSEADLRGLRVGDEIYQINGYKISDAVTQELSRFVMEEVKRKSRITLRVRGVGIIPIKDCDEDPLTWQAIYIAKQGKLYENLERVILTLAPKTKLGCGICKGPEWKSGIFVQYTKENGVARNAGLRPGDQLVACNGVDFTNISFEEAVSIMKASHTLDLLVRVLGGIELFPNESSGYNSSASSVDQSWLDGGGGLKEGFEKRRELRAKSRERMLKTATPPKPPIRSKQTQISTSEKNGVNNTTVIKLSENGTVINNILISHYQNGEDKKCDKKEGGGNSETKTIKVEVHQSATTTSTSVIPPPPPPAPFHASSASANGGLKCALFEEIRRRAEKKELAPPPPPAEPTKKTPASISPNKQHDALMEEFKLVHKRMFKPKDDDEDAPAPTPTPDYDSLPYNGTLARVTAAEMARANGDAAEMDSIESFKVNTDTGNPLKFPKQYFQPEKVPPETIRKANPQVMVKVDEFQMKSSSILTSKRDSDSAGSKSKNRVTIMVPNSKSK